MKMRILTVSVKRWLLAVWPALCERIASSIATNRRTVRNLVVFLRPGSTALAPKPPDR